MSKQPRIVRPVVQPSTRLWAVAGAAALFSVFAAIALSGVSPFLVLPLSALAATLAFGMQALSMRRSALRSEAGQIVMRTVFRERVVSTEVAPARLVKVTVTDTGTPHNRGLIWTGGPEQIMLMAEAWNVDELFEIAEEHGLEISQEPEPFTLPELSRAYPGVVPWAGAHPKAAAFAVLVVLFGGFAVWSVLA